MKKQKLTLSNLKVESFVTSLNSSGIKTIQAGLKVVYDSSGATGSPTCPDIPAPTYPVQDCYYTCTNNALCTRVPNDCICP